MQIRSVHAVLPVSYAEAFEFLSHLANLPRWATEFIRGGVQVDGDVAVADTAHGRASLRLRSDSETGVIDHLVTFSMGGDAVFPSRVLPLPDGRSVFVFTGIQGPEQPREAFDRDFASLERELAGLPNLFTRRHANAD